MEFHEQISEALQDIHVEKHGIWKASIEFCLSLLLSINQAGE